MVRKTHLTANLTATRSEDDSARRRRTADHPSGGLAAWEREMLLVMSRILTSGLSFHDIRELLAEALETAVIYPAVADAAASLGWPPVLSVPGMGRAEAEARARCPMWRAIYLLGTARRIQRCVHEALAQGVPDEDVLRVALRFELPCLRVHVQVWRDQLAAARAADALSTA